MTPCSDSSIRRRRAAVTWAAMLLAATLAACSVDAGNVSAPLVPATDPASADAASPFAGASLLVDTASPARATATAWRTTRPADAAQLDKIAQEPLPRWFGPWTADPRADVDATVSSAVRAGALPVLVAYDMPNVGCGGPSGTSSATSAAYRTWITQFAAGIGARRAAVILEPDALGSMDCLTADQQQERLGLFRAAVQALSASGTIAVYLDAGNPGWQPASVMASRLRDAGVMSTRGFALNIANFITTRENVAYGASLSALLGGKHFVIDTGRNGAGTNGDWCNPAGRALGERPMTPPTSPLVDALLWIKAPGESDGACNGATYSGQWLPEYALGLAQRAAY